MNLTDLRAVFLSAYGNHLHHVDTLEEANGVRFLCPKCFEQNKGEVGTHAVMCFKPGTILDWTDSPARWTMTGSSLEDLTLSPSILITTGCKWHGFVEHGAIRTC